ncbi:hypothetical protein BGZ54_002165 [Gamsiella multidivaricata]|nr:hypothetical protein BGZ54_002165 [Gamsiella multidivaricata]
MTNTTEHKPSAMETIKDKASHLVHKVTGNHDHHDSTAPTTHTESINQHHDVAYGTAQPSVNLAPTTFPREGETSAAGAAHTHAPGAHALDHHHHKIDDPQHGITSRLIGERGDPNNVESLHLKPTM